MCDDSEGLGVSKILSDPEYLKLFGYGPAAEAAKKAELEKKAEKEKEAAKENGSVSNGVDSTPSAVAPTDTGVVAV